jgi:hypothetical protein
MRYAFHTTKFEPTGDPVRFRCFTLEAYAKTPEEAYALIAGQIPEGHRVWMWHAEPWACCSACGGPYHPATGHRASEGTRWCGPCTRDFVQMLVGFTRRRWHGVRFYEHATVPPEATP